MSDPISIVTRILDASSIISAPFNGTTVAPPPSFRVVQVSTPITTGKHFYTGQAHSVKLNRDYAFSFIDRIPRVVEPPFLVLNPTAFTEVAGWSENEYMSLWTTVMSRFVNAVVFVADWQYSAGSCEEYLHAFTEKIPCYDELGKYINANTAASMIYCACQRISAWGHKPDRQAFVARELRSYCQSLGKDG